MGGLDALLNASEEEKEARGIRYTPREINQQPASWRKTFQIVQGQQTDLRRFLLESGFDLRKPFGNPTVFLIGAGTSDYVGRALTYLLRRMWGCEVWAVPSTDLLTNLEDLVFPEHKYFLDFILSLRRRFGRIGRSRGGRPADLKAGTHGTGFAISKRRKGSVLQCLNLRSSQSVC